MINKTRWEPDTCGCMFVYEWDSDSLPDNRVHTVVEATMCEYHKYPDMQSCFDVVLAENRSKNTVLAEIAKQVPGVDISTIEWEYDESRSLTIKTDNLAPDVAAAVNAAISSPSLTVE